MNKTKLKTLFLGALLTTSLSAKAVNSDQNTHVNDSTSNKTIKMENLTIAQMETFINEANVALAQLLQKIRNPHTPHQERLDAFDAYEKLEFQRDDMVKMLEAKRSGKTFVLNYAEGLENLTIEELRQYISDADKKIYRLERKGVSPQLSSEAREKIHEEYKDLKRRRNEAQKRLDALSMQIVAANEAGARR